MVFKYHSLARPVRQRRGATYQQITAQSTRGIQMPSACQSFCYRLGNWHKCAAHTMHSRKTTAFLSYSCAFSVQVGIAPARSGVHVRPAKSTCETVRQRAMIPTCEMYRRALAVDYGLKRVGMAVSVGIAPRPLPCYHHDSSPEEAAKAVAAAAYGAVAKDIIVGLPLTALGREGEQAIATRLFTTALVKAAPWARICLVDERFTTQEARASLVDANVSAARIPGMIDSASAVLIAERFFASPSQGTPIVVHEPSPRDEDEPGYLAGEEGSLGGERVERESFFAWKQNSMARAAEQALQMGKNRKRRKPGGRKKK
jgi:putative holliday junction resolvase